MYAINYEDIFKTILIIILFIVIILLIFVTTNPGYLKKLFCSFCENKIVEGFTSDCYKCIIIPSIGSIYNNNGINNIKNDIMLRTETDTDNVIPTNGDSYNLYKDSLQDASYVFCSWKTPSNNPEVKNWFTDCSYINDTSCCLINDTSYSDFYNNNYLLDNSYNKKYYGIVFKFNVKNSIKIGDQRDMEFNPELNPKNHNMYNLSTYSFESALNGDKFVDNRFEYISTSKKFTINQDNSGNIKKGINCFGEIVDISYNNSLLNTCNLSSQNLVDEIGLNNVINLQENQELCWKIGSQYGEISMNEYCEISNVNLSDCQKLYLPIPGKQDTIKSLFDKNSLYTGATNTMASPLLTEQVQSHLQNVTDNLVKQFTDKIDSINTNLGKAEYPNIGNPTYLNIGTCNNNSPYVYNSNCANSENTQSGKFLYQYQCYPSLTGEFTDCGPQGYQSNIEF